MGGRGVKREWKGAGKGVKMSEKRSANEPKRSGKMSDRNGPIQLKMFLNR
jgi:hypothetical protein